MSDNVEDVFVGGKPLPSYLTAGLWAINKVGSVRYLGRGTNIKTTVDVAEILKRQLNKPQVDIAIGSEDFEDRKISTIEITISGSKKEKEK